MSRLSLWRLMAAVFLFGTGCGGCNTELETSNGALVMTPEIADFNTVCLNSTSELDITLQNTGRGNVTISDPTFSNPAFALLADLPQELGIDQSVVARIGFTPTVAGPYSSYFTVTTNAATNPKVTAQLLGQGFSGESRDFDVTCICDDDPSSGQTCGLAAATSTSTVNDPCRFLTFENVLDGTTVQRTVTVTNKGCEPVNFTQDVFADTLDSPAEASTYQTWFSFDPPPPTPVRGGQSINYTVQFSPPVTAASAAPAMSLTLISDDTESLQTDQAVAGQWELGLIAGATTPALQVTPDILTFYNATMGTPDVQSFTITNTGTSSLHIDSMTLSGSSQFSLASLSSSDLGSGQSEPVEVTFTATGAGFESGTVTVTGGGSAQTVSLAGGAYPQLNVTWLDPSTNDQTVPPVNWGNTPTGDKNDPRTVTLQNVGTADLVVTKVVTRDPTNTEASNSFSVTSFSPPVTISPGSSSSLVVVFNDDITITNNAGKLVIYSNDPAYAPNGGYDAVQLETTDSPAYPPVPDITVSPEPEKCKALTLDGSQSFDPQGSPLTYKWGIQRVPSGSQITLTAPTGESTSVTSPSCMGPDVSGTYVFTLTVQDQYPQNAATISQVVNVQ